MKEIDNQSINALRFLSVDMINNAQSGHPGTAIDAAPMAYELWENQIYFNPMDPHWLNRDRFVLSPGHASALLYSLLYLNKFDLTLKDLKHFRKLNSKMPGHPEYDHPLEVEATIGSLSQGLGMAVGMAMAEQHMASIYNKPGYNIIDHYTYAIISDGDLMEGLSHEAISIAGDKKLAKLIFLYDSNDVSLDGPLNLSTNENVKKRFEAENWDYHFVADGNDLQQLHAAIEGAQKTIWSSIIEVYGTPLAGTNKIHGSVMNKTELQQMRPFYHWHHDPFMIPADIYQNYENKVAQKQKYYDEWQQLFMAYQKQYPQEASYLRTSQLNTTNLTYNFCYLLLTPLYQRL